MPSATSSDFLHQSQMDYLLKGVEWIPPDTLYVALFNTLPSLADAGGQEVSTAGTGYSRKPISKVDGWTGPDASGIYANAEEILFDQPTANWGTINGAGLYDAATDGNLFYVSQLTTSKVVSDGDGGPKILQGQLRILRAVC